MEYSLGPYNKFDAVEQWIRLTEGCPHHHEYCYEPKEIKIFDIPKIVRNSVKIMDMNLLCKKEAWGILQRLPHRVNGKVVHYELICGIDFRVLTQEIADCLHQLRFKNMRIAWDLAFADQFRIKKAIGMLKKAGYNARGQLMIFMVCNWKVPYETNLRKLDLCKVWGVKVADCWWDNQLSPNIKPEFWTAEQIKDFRHRCRKHNQMVLFGIDPQTKCDCEVCCG